MDGFVKFLLRLEQFRVNLVIRAKVGRGENAPALCGGGGTGFMRSGLDVHAVPPEKFNIHYAWGKTNGGDLAPKDEKGLSIIIGRILCKTLGDVFDKPEQESANGKSVYYENCRLKNRKQDIHVSFAAFFVFASRWKIRERVSLNKEFKHGSSALPLAK